MDTQPVETETLTATLSDATGFGGQFTIPYPSGRSASDYASGRALLRSASRDVLHEARGQFTTNFGASSVTIVIQVAASYAEGETVYLDVDMGAQTRDGDKLPAAKLADESKMDRKVVYSINLGAPAPADADGAVASQAATAAGGLATGINGALAANDVATFDVPRNVVAAWTNTAVLTVTGTDEYGNVIVESSASGTSLTGKKAFKTVTGISVSADVTGLTVGTGVVLGLPCYLADTGDILAEKEDGAAATTGTALPGVTGTQTATTGDVRGTYSPNTAPNGSAQFELVIASRDPSYKGAEQYAG